MHALVLLALAATLPDHGIFPELDDRIVTVIPGGVHRELTWLRVDGAHQLVTLYDARDPLKVYRANVSDTLAAATVTTVKDLDLKTLLAPADAAEFRPHLRPESRVVVGVPARTEDRDGDGIVDRIDIVLGARKLVENKARYIERYVDIPYPGGDVPRTEGVCTDTVIRSLRNAGIDLQKEVHEDLLRHPEAYPMVEKVNASINHRRVKTVVRWFERHFTRLPDGTAYRPGDVVFFDTFPAREGPDHLGIVSDLVAPNGQQMVVNNWTEGYVDSDLELLSWVPVTHHFRAP